jgi:hypothetical protein
VLWTLALLSLFPYHTQFHEYYMDTVQLADATVAETCTAEGRQRLHQQIPDMIAVGARLGVCVAYDEEDDGDLNGIDQEEPLVGLYRVHLLHDCVMTTDLAAAVEQCNQQMRAGLGDAGLAVLLSAA